MQLTRPPHPETKPFAESLRKKGQRRSAKTAEEPATSEYAIEEINSYIAIRDGLLAEAEKAATSDMLRRVSIANDFVEACLKPSRSPYHAQYLPEADAVRERQHCERVKQRIAQLGARK